MSDINVTLLKQRIELAKSIVIFSHVNPDGDALGSTLCLFNFLKSQGKDSCVILPNDIPDYLKWLPGASDVIVDKVSRNKSDKCIRNADLLICMDFNEMKRTDQLKDRIIASMAFKIVIDHHPFPSNEFDLVYSRTDISSTSEWIYHLLGQLYGSEQIPYDSLIAAYTGIMTDTGNFVHNTWPSTFIIVSEMLARGINRDQIYSKVFDNYSVDRMRLLGMCIKDNMVFKPEYNTAYITLTKKEQEAYNFNQGDSEGFVNIPLSIKEVVFSAFFIEKDNHVKISLRSKGVFDVNEIARNYFNGGGHKNASGGELKMSMSEVVQIMENLLPEYKTKLNDAINSK